MKQTGPRVCLREGDVICKDYADRSWTEMKRRTWRVGFGETRWSGLGLPKREIRRRVGSSKGESAEFNYG